MNDNDIYWKGPKSMYTFGFKRITHANVKQYFVSLDSKANSDLLDFDIEFIKYAALLISESLFCNLVAISARFECVRATLAKIHISDQYLVT